MDDEPIPDLRYQTPVDHASMHALSYMRSHGTVKYRHTVPEGLVPATDIALLTILGIPIKPDFSSRSWLEAIGGGLTIGKNDLILRCNLISHSNGKIVSHCGYNPSPQECRKIVNILNDQFGNDIFSFHGFGNFRCLLVVRDCMSSIVATPPHTILGETVGLLRIVSDNLWLESRLNQFIEAAQKILEGHIANGIALWAPGRAAIMPRQIKGSVVAGVNIVKGIGKALGMTVVDIPDATGDEFTNYAAKLNAALKALENDNFVLLHIEAPDEASHQLDWRKKISILEKIDRLILMPLLALDEPMHITVQSDHATSSLTGHHLSTPVTVVDYILNAGKSV